MTKLNCLLGSVLLCSTVTGHAANSDIDMNGIQLAQSYTNDTIAVRDFSSQSKVYGPVHKSENLWSILAFYRTDDMTMSQMATVVYERNQSAFYNNNMNFLKIGELLEIPPDKELLAEPFKPAHSKVLAHIRHYENLVEQHKAGGQPENDVPLVSSINPKEFEMIKSELLKEESKGAIVEVVEPAKPKRALRERKKAEKPLFRYSYDLSVAHDDNVRKAQNEIDIRSDVLTSLTLNARGGKSLSRFSLLSYGGSATYESFSTFDELNNFSFNANVKYRVAFSSGFTAPLYSIGLKLGGIESDAEMRDSTTAALALSLNKWMTNTINMTVGFDHREQVSKSEVFDTTEDRLFVNLDLNLSKKMLLYGTYTYITGDVVSSASPTLDIINESDAIEPDDAFGGIGLNQFAYRLDADTQVITIGYNQIFSNNMSIDLSFRAIETEADNDIGYDRQIIRASLLGRF